MNISEERLEQEKQDFLTLKQNIAEELGFHGFDEDEMEENLKVLISMTSELFDNSMNDLVLRKYYNSFLTYIYPQIRLLLENNKNGTTSLSISLFTLKAKINRNIKRFLDYSLSSYFYLVNDGYLVNTMNSHEALLSEDLGKLMERTDIFRVNHNYIPEIATKHPAIEYNYEPAYWEMYADSIRLKVASLDERLNEKVPDFLQNLELYERYIELYKDYIRKYRFITASKELENQVKER